MGLAQKIAGNKSRRFAFAEKRKKLLRCKRKKERKKETRRRKREERETSIQLFFAPGLVGLGSFLALLPPLLCSVVPSGINASRRRGGGRSIMGSHHREDSHGAPQARAEPTHQAEVDSSDLRRCHRGSC